MKPKRTTAQHEKTGITENVLLFKDGSMHFDYGMASVPVTDKAWIPAPKGKPIHFWFLVATFIVVVSYLDYWSLS
jgi:hypothetical protein